MMEIVVVSGKGGVGKTTVSASLMLLLWRAGFRLVGADCDVDAPNLALVLPGEEERLRPITASEKAFIDYGRCDGCGKCIPHCKFGALSDVGNRVSVYQFLCEGCGVCALVCPQEAIEIRGVESGVVVTSRTRYGFPLVTGRLNMGEAGSGKIVTAVKAIARKLAEDIKADLLLVDGPPGVGCPVISSMAGAHQVVAVTEPTPAALHDLDRVLMVARHFKIPSAIIINKADLHPPTRAKILRYAEENNIEVLGEIPVDKAVPYSIARAKPVVDYAPESRASAAIRSIMERLLQTVRP